MSNEDFESTVLCKLTDIHDQVVRTNGRVTNIEQWRETAEPELRMATAWKDRMAGAIGILVVLVVPVLIYIVQGWVR